MKKKLLFLLMIITLLPCGEAHAKKAAKPKPKPWEVRAGYQAIYESNVYDFSRDTIEDLEMRNDPFRFKHIESADDWIHRLNINPEYKFRPFRRLGSTKLGGNFTASIYQNNDAKDYEKYEIYVKQYLNKKRDILRVGFEYLPDFYLRNFFDRDLRTVDRYKQAIFDSKDLYAKWWHSFGKNLSGWVEYTYDVKNYNSAFDERDTKSDEFDLSLDYTPNKWLTLTPHFSMDFRDAKGSSIGSVHPDVSREAYSPGFGVTVKPVKKLYMTVDYTITWEDYTTNNSPTDDPYHSGRSDLSQRLTAKTSYLILKNVEIFGKYQYQVDDAEIDKSAVASPSTDEGVLGYDSHTVSIGVNVSF